LFPVPRDQQPLSALRTAFLGDWGSPNFLSGDFNGDGKADMPRFGAAVPLRCLYEALPLAGWYGAAEAAPSSAANRQS
jgi:hypothetical protein